LSATRSSAQSPGSIWAIVPAAGRGERFGGGVPKQYLQLHGRPLLAHALDRLLAHPLIAGAVVALAADDAHWPRMRKDFVKPVLECVGGASRAQSVLAGLRRLPDGVDDDALVLVHDAARPCLRAEDLERLIDAALRDPVGALLGAPVRDTLKRADAQLRVVATEPRESLWRALTPQAFRRGTLARALCEAEQAGVAVTDEAMAIERLGLQPLLVHGAGDNLKVTVPADLALAASILQGMLQDRKIQTP
jgi:2-C-methyl-D-erythritol 4-phosphate cytidylyltransferase